MLESVQRKYEMYIVCGTYPRLQRVSTPTHRATRQQMYPVQGRGSQTAWSQASSAVCTLFVLGRSSRFMPNDSETGLTWMIRGHNLEMSWGVKLFDTIEVPDGVSTLWGKKKIFPFHIHTKAHFCWKASPSTAFTIQFFFSLKVDVFNLVYSLGNDYSNFSAITVSDGFHISL